jgi:hypothetical protein
VSFLLVEKVRVVQVFVLSSYRLNTTYVVKDRMPLSGISIVTK